MSEDAYPRLAFDAARDAQETIRRARGLPPRDGGGTYEGMEARVTRLEEDVKEMKSDLKAIRLDLSYLRGKVDSMPTTLQLLGFVIVVLVAAGLMRYFGPA